MTENRLYIQLQKFINAYYNNKIYNGLVVWVSIAVILFLGLVFSEYFSYFSSPVRAVLFYGFIAANLLVFCILVAEPLLRRFSVLPQMSYEKAAKIIGAHFPEIDDKLLNAIQLNEQVANCPPENTELLLACVEQRTMEMNKFHFSLAINWQKTKRYAKYAIIPLLLLLCIFVLNNQLITKPTQRIVQYEQYFEKPAPYSFVLLNKDLKIFENDDFTIKVKIEGDEMPAEVFVKIDNAEYQMQQMAVNQFQFELKNVQKNTQFIVFSPETNSQTYEIQVLPQPILVSFVMDLNYPAYTGKPDEKIENNSDISVPQGTIISWNFYVRNTDAVVFKHQDQNDTLSAEKDKAACRLRLLNSIEYTIFNVNTFMQNKDSIVGFVHVVADQYPSIDVKTMHDSVFADRYYFRGNIKDDYGFEKLYFVYTVTEKGNSIEQQKIPIDIEKYAVVQDFYYYFDAQTLNLSQGQQVEFYFEVWDNDAINGSKASKSNPEVFYLPSLDEIHQQTANSNKQVKSDLEKLMKESEKILSQIENLKKEMLNQNQATWQEKKEMENLLKQLQDIRKQGEAIVQEQKRQEHINQQYNDLNQEIVDKQKELQKRFDELFNDEMKSMMQELQMMLNQNIDKNKMNQMIDNIKTNTEEINKSLDQQLELFKQLEIEAKMDNIISKSLQLAEQEEQLAEKTLQQSQNPQSLSEQQEHINQQFEALKSDIQEMENLNKSLEDAYNLDSVNALKSAVEQKLHQASEQLKQKHPQKAAQTQKEAAEKMKELAQEIETQMQESEDENLGEDIQTIRQTLDNIVSTSFAQEEILQKMNQTQVHQPAMKDIILQQYKLKDKLKLIEDSIAAVARRQIMVEPFISKQIRTISQAQTDIMNLMNSSQEQMSIMFYGQSYGRQIAAKQQFIMTSLNDLALMLAESMKNMQQKQSQGQAGNRKGKCNSESCGSQPSKSGKKSMKTMRQMQEQLNRQLEEMRKQMQQGGKQPNAQQKGQQQGQGQSLSEQFARMAAQQEAIRKMMQDYQSQLKKEGKGYDGQIDKMLKEMEQTERELVNKILNEQTINRQQQIMTRLLESEKAEQQREKDDQRKSTQAKDYKIATPPAYIEQELKKQKETELYKTIPPTLNRYYRDKVNTYFYNFQYEK
ncbi:MAG: hypothetical protein J5606_09375 [Bacteroidales bacterium]|nr:hypothetical protein [Bacteroidales bacterium]